MCERLIVLKLGGSVLRDAGSLPHAVHEIYRWHREGTRVVAVVSAFAGVTEALLARASQGGSAPDSHALAALLSGGEHESAAYLALALDRAGVSAEVLSPAALRLTARGPALDAVPFRCETDRIHAALERSGVVVVPGFAAIDETGRTVVLGRGGSDATALFLAHVLGARCRLVKDVGGIYERDPARGDAPRRFEALAFDRALELGGRVVQAQSLRFARDLGIAFEVGGLQSDRVTLVGAPATRLACSSALGGARPLRVAVLGAGTVGGGVLEALAALREDFQVVAVAVRDAGRDRSWRGDHPTAQVLGDAVRAASQPVDLVIEALGGTGVARRAIVAALERGAEVVTANKAVMAAHGIELRARAHRRGLSLLASACVGGAVPILERLRTRGGAPVRGVRGVLNATSNFVLERCGGGVSLHDALAEARELGFAERDASRDLDGRDAADKLVCIAHELGVELRGDEVVRDALDLGGERRFQVAELELDGSRARARVSCTALAAGDPLRETHLEQNAVLVERTDGSRELLRGRGAGRWPTTEAVLGDALEVRRSHSRGLRPVLRHPPLPSNARAMRSAVAGLSSPD